MLDFDGTGGQLGLGLGGNRSSLHEPVCLDGLFALHLGMNKEQETKPKELTFLLRVGVGVGGAEVHVAVVTDIAVAIADRVRVGTVQHRTTSCHIVAVAVVRSVWSVGCILAGCRLTQWQDFDARKLANTVLEYLIGFGQSHVFEADIVNGEYLIASVDGTASIGDAGRLDALHKYLVLSIQRRLSHSQFDSDGRTGRLFDFDK